MPESAEDGILAAHSGLDRGGVEDVAAGNGKTLMLYAEPGGVPDERRHVVATLESLLNERATSTAGCADYQESHIYGVTGG